MYNATIKPLLAAAVIAASLAACSGSKPNHARELYNQAEDQLAAGNIGQVYALLDSIKSQYPDSVHLLREGLNLRHRAMLLESQNETAAIDDSIAICMEKVSAMQPRLKKVDDPRLVEPYYVAKEGYDPNFMTTTGLQAHVDELGQFTLISSLQAAYKHTGITLVCGDESASAGPVPYDGECNYRINGSEIITFSPAQSQAIGELAAAHPGTTMTLKFTGGKPHSVKLSAKQVDAIATCYTYARYMTLGRHLSYQKEKLARQQQLLSDNI